MGKQSISVLAVDDEESFLSLLQTILEPEGYDVQTARDGVEAINLLQSKSFDLALLDVKMPRVDGVEVLKYVKDRFLDLPVIMLTGVGDLKVAVECMKLGASNYLSKPYSTDELLTVIDSALERRRLVIENKALKSELARHAVSSHMIGNSPKFLGVLAVAHKVAPTDSAVLIQGSSGTGKELVASFLHRNSLRNSQPFMALNCASIPETLIESELFGHEKGAFTDAHTAKQGLVEIANGGTLFLDEIGEVSLMIQPKLLRFLQTGEYRRVGGNKVLKSDVRVISATNKDLRAEVATGRFREDLLYRINVITLQIPALRDRKDDIPLLVEYFLKNKIRSRNSIRIDPKALDVLQKYYWPGNVRELENVIERAAILCRDSVIQPDDLALPLGTHGMLEVPAAADGKGPQIGSAVSIREIEKSHIDGVLRNVNWNKNMAARILGISLKTLYTKIQQYNLTKE
ncbi:MAG: sigma-54-dependent Fis family transcriptional regulator [Ignavibacteriales bacterium]|nr:sigma-54-dependent Fis family transcriptional regulator [Ignavibacteriales bacterium]